MSKKHSKPRISWDHRPLPPPPDNSLGCNLIYLVASIFHNTSSFSYKKKEGDNYINIEYEGFRPGKNYIK